MRWLFGNFPTADFHKTWPQNMNLCLLKMYQKGYSKIFTLGVICPKNLKIELDQTRVHPRDTLKRYCSLHKSKGQGVSEVWSTLLYHIRFWNYRTSKFTNFRIFTYFPHTQCQKKDFFVTSLHPRGYIAERFQLFCVVAEGPKGCLLLVRFSCNL